jgi:hexosaminidase
MNLAVIPRPSRALALKGRMPLGGPMQFAVLGLHPGLAGQAGLIERALAGKNRRVQPVSARLEMDPALAKRLGPEGYSLVIRAEGLHLSAAGIAGIRHGVSTLRQLAEAAKGPWLQAMAITDIPQFAWRGLLIDSCRHFQSVEFLKRTLDEMAYFKLNRMHWHLTEDVAWRLEIKKYPRLTKEMAPGGFYSQAQVKELVAYAAERGITIIPEIEVPGHSGAAMAAYPELSCTGGPGKLPRLFQANKDIFCAGKETGFRFIENVLKEVVALFPSAQIHIGCDEVPKDRWRACPHCQARITKLKLKDEKALQSYFAARCIGMLKKLGRAAVAWDEINEGVAPPGVIVQCWHAQKPDLVAQAAKDGHLAIASSTEFCYFDYSNWSLDLKKAWSFRPVPAGLNAAQRRRVLGGEAALWTEYVPQARVHPKLFPRLLGTCEALWSGGKSYPEFKRRALAQMRHLARRGVKSGPAGSSPREKALPWEPAFWDARFPSSLKMPTPWT